jgi:hypothetical protein
VWRDGGRARRQGERPRAREDAALERTAVAQVVRCTRLLAASSQLCSGGSQMKKKAQKKVSKKKSVNLQAIDTTELERVYGGIYVVADGTKGGIQFID